MLCMCLFCFLYAFLIMYFEVVLIVALRFCKLTNSHFSYAKNACDHRSISFVRVPRSAKNLLGSGRWLSCGERTFTELLG